MSDFDAHLVWDSLIARASPSGWLFTRVHPDAPCEVLVAVRKPQNALALLIEVASAAVPPGLDFSESVGLLVEIESAAPGPDGRTRFCIILRRSELRDIFAIVVRDVASAVAFASSAKAAVRVLDARIRVWQAFFRSPGVIGLGPLAERGLMGELLILRDHLLPAAASMARAIAGWTGPEGASQDFQYPGLAIEVKTTSGHPAPPFSVSGILQLDEENVAILFLAHVCLDVSPAGQTLPEIVRDISALLDADPAARVEFDDRTLAAGYLPAHAGRYVDRYVAAGNRFFDVRDDFPRIKAGEVRPGVSMVTYSVDLAWCVEYEVSAGDFGRSVAEHV